MQDHNFLSQNSQTFRARQSMIGTEAQHDLVQLRHGPCNAMSCRAITACLTSLNLLVCREDCLFKLAHSVLHLSYLNPKQSEYNKEVRPTISFTQIIQGVAPTDEETDSGLLRDVTFGDYSLEPSQDHLRNWYKHQQLKG